MIYDKFAHLSKISIFSERLRSWLKRAVNGFLFRFAILSCRNVQSSYVTIVLEKRNTFQGVARIMSREEQFEAMLSDIQKEYLNVSDKMEALKAAHITMV